MRSLTITSSFRARRHAARGIPYDREVIILNSREDGYHTAKSYITFSKQKYHSGVCPNITHYHAANLRIKIAAEARTNAASGTNARTKLNKATMPPIRVLNLVETLAVELHSATSRNDRYIIVKNLFFA